MMHHVYANGSKTVRAFLRFFASWMFCALPIYKYIYICMRLCCILTLRFTHIG